MSYIGVACGLGAQNPDTKLGPRILIDEGEFIEGLASVGEYVAAVEKKVAATCDLPIVIGGDHSIAVGTWRGLRCRPFGLIWLDAHMDMHTQETTPSGAVHGMPLATLLLEKTVLPEHVCIVGVHSYEKEEMELAQKLGVRVYEMDEIKKRGFSVVMDEARTRVTAGTQGYGISLDLDCIDPEEAPGVGSKEPGGLHVDELLSGLKKDERLVALEIVEYNPNLDVDKKTAAIVPKIIERLT